MLNAMEVFSVVKGQALHKLKLSVGLNRLPGDLEMTGNVRGQETSGGT
jgi:hypothetical protein